MFCNICLHFVIILIYSLIVCHAKVDSLRDCGFVKAVVASMVPLDIPRCCEQSSWAQVTTSIVVGTWTWWQIKLLVKPTNSRASCQTGWDDSETLHLSMAIRSFSPISTLHFDRESKKPSQVLSFIKYKFFWLPPMQVRSRHDFQCFN